MFTWVVAFWTSQLGLLLLWRAESVQDFIPLQWWLLHYQLSLWMRNTPSARFFPCLWWESREGPWKKNPDIGILGFCHKMSHLLRKLVSQKLNSRKADPNPNHVLVSRIQGITFMNHIGWLFGKVYHRYIDRSPTSNGRAMAFKTVMELSRVWHRKVGKPNKTAWWL